MPKTRPPRVLVSFIGKGMPADSANKTSAGTHTGYRTARYGFSDPDYQSEATSLFGIALTRYYSEINQKPTDYWLVLGSPQSNWDALLEAVPEKQWDDALNQMYEQVQKAVRSEEEQPTPEGKGEVTQKLLDDWSNALSERLGSPRVECYLIGWSESTASQMRMWQILNERIPEEAEVVFDITHGFRHQPMLLATMAVLMDYLKRFKCVTFYYGAFDMPKPASAARSENPSKKDRIAPVLKIDLFPDLMNYIRELGVLQVAGNYEALGEYLLRDQKVLKKQLRSIAFKERANLSILPNEVETFLRDLKQWQPESAVDKTFQEILIDQLSKRQAEYPWERMALRAGEADKHHDYLSAYALLWEAIVSVSVLIINPEKQEQIDEVDVRQESIDRLIRYHVQQSEAETLIAFRAVRNWIVHGTSKENKRAREAMQSSEKLRQLFEEAREVFISLLADLKNTNPQDSEETP